MRLVLIGWRVKPYLAAVVSTSRMQSSYRTCYKWNQCMMHNLPHQRHHRSSLPPNSNKLPGFANKIGNRTHPSPTLKALRSFSYAPYKDVCPNPICCPSSQRSRSPSQQPFSMPLHVEAALLLGTDRVLVPHRTDSLSPPRHIARSASRAQCFLRMGGRSNVTKKSFSWSPGGPS